MSINFSDLSRGMVIELDAQPWQIMDYERHKMQQRAPVTRIKMRNLINGTVVERTFQRYDTAFAVADIDNREAQFLYTDGQHYYFLDQESFDQHELSKELLGSALNYLKEQMIVEVVFYKGSAISINSADPCGTGSCRYSTCLPGRYRPGRDKACDTGDRTACQRAHVHYSRHYCQG